MVGLDPADALAGLRKALGDDAAGGAAHAGVIPPARSDPDARLTLGPR